MSDDDQVAPRLHVIMRSYGGENFKDRPTFYSKLACLGSLIRAAASVRPSPELIFVNDGPLPADRERLMQLAGEVVTLDAGSNRASYRWTISMAVERPWSPHDVVWFAEDDYLYTIHSFARLLEAAGALPQADYLSMYGGDARFGREAGYGDVGTTCTGTARVGDWGWGRHLSTTSSFGVRARQLREDARLLRLMPATGGAWDHATCLAYQGLLPFSRKELQTDLVPFTSQPPIGWPRAVARGVVRGSLSLRALRRSSRRRLLYGAEPDLIAHMEVGGYSDRVDWEAVSSETTRWVHQALEYNRLPTIAHER
jgi:hypothetical protein